MFWVLIKSDLLKSANEYNNLCFCGEIRKKYQYFLFSFEKVSYLVLNVYFICVYIVLFIKGTVYCRK